MICLLKIKVMGFYTLKTLASLFKKLGKSGRVVEGEKIP